MISDLRDKSFKTHFKDFLFKELVGFLLGVIAMYEAATLIAHAKYISLLLESLKRVLQIISESLSSPRWPINDLNP
jgi:hypothetical protein